VGGRGKVQPYCFLGIGATVGNKLTLGQRTLRRRRRAGCFEHRREQRSRRADVGSRRPEQHRVPAGDDGKGQVVSWKKLGHVYAPDGSLPWARSYAANPVAEHIEGDLFRIYFSCRDEKNRSSIGFIEININKPQKILRVADQPVLAPGDLAMFDDSGASIGCIVKAGDKRYLYYMGWHLTVSVPWQNALGLAISESRDEPFKRYARFPTVPLDETDPYTISYPWVSHDNGKFRMWYGSNIAWGAAKEDMRPPDQYAGIR